jgi:hypothetical protein
MDNTSPVHELWDTAKFDAAINLAMHKIRGDSDFMDHRQGHKAIQMIAKLDDRLTTLMEESSATLIDDRPDLLVKP